jgi:GxxExxY protein
VIFVFFCQTLQTEELLMHPLFQKSDQLSSQVIGGAIEAHRVLGAGLLESIYEKCLMHELELRRLSAVQQRCVKIVYKQITFEEQLRFDVLVEGCLLIEIKAVQEVAPIHKAQLLSYMKLLDVPLGLLFNFHELRLVDGLTRMMLSGANL